MRLFLVIFFLMFVAADVCGQSNRADRYFEQGDYLEALKLYRKQLENAGDDESQQTNLLKMRVAYCFFHMNDMIRAEQMYKRVSPNFLGAEELTYYAITLVHTGNYEKASGQLELAEDLGADPIILKRIRSTCEFAAQVLKEKPIYSANKTKINFRGLSSGATYHHGKSIILAAPGRGENVVRDNRGYITTRFYKTVFTGDGTSGSMSPFANELTDKYHIGAATFTRDFKRIYYTRTIIKNDGKSILKLITANEENGKWGNIEELSINSDDYSCVQPSLYNDSILFFVSDMPGGVGGKDLYTVEVNGAECGAIKNLGRQINTSDDESFPFVAKDGRLYFASNGHIGLGGLDIFVSQQNAKGVWASPQNMGRPINSSMDDFALIFRNTDCTDGFVSSNRGSGYNDFLFGIKLLQTKTFKPQLENKVQQPIVVQEVPTSNQNKVVRQIQIAERPDNRQVQAPIEKKVSNEELFLVDYRYAIQIGAFRNPVPRVYFEHLKNVKVYLGYDNIYRYAVGEYPDELFATTDLQHVKRDIADAFVMNVGQYVADRKIQNDTKGDVISDDELLLRRLKNFEKRGVLLNKKQKLPPRGRVLSRPKSSEIQRSKGSETPIDKGYTVVLMSADKVFNPNRLNGINNIDVLAISEGNFMYCAGIFSTENEALAEMEKVRSMGFNQSYIMHRRGKLLYSEPSQALPPKSSSSHRNAEDLKDLLDF